MQSCHDIVVSQSSSTILKTQQERARRRQHAFAAEKISAADAVTSGRLTVLDPKPRKCMHADTNAPVTFCSLASCPGTLHNSQRTLPSIHSKESKACSWTKTQPQTPRHRHSDTDTQTHTARHRHPDTDTQTQTHRHTSVAQTHTHLR